MMNILFILFNLLQNLCCVISFFVIGKAKVKNAEGNSLSLSLSPIPFISQQMRKPSSSELHFSNPTFSFSSLCSPEAESKEFTKHGPSRGGAAM